MMDLPIYTLKSRVTHSYLQPYNLLMRITRGEVHMTAQSTGVTDIAFKGRQRYRISGSHKIMYAISTYSLASICNPR